MEVISHFLSEYFFVYIWMIFTTFLNIIAPISGSTIINPVTAFFTDPQRAIGLGAFLFFFSGIHRVYLFRNEIFSNSNNINVVKSMLPFSVVGAIGGGFLISYLNTKLLAVIIVLISLSFIYKTIKQIIYNKKLENKNNKFGFVFVALLTGFLQGSGMPGADMRNNYLRTVISEIAVRATSSMIGLVNFFIGGTIIFIHNKLTVNDLIFTVTLIPFLIMAQVYGKRFLDKMTDNHAKIVAISLSLLGIVLLTYKYLL